MSLRLDENKHEMKFDSHTPTSEPKHSPVWANLSKQILLLHSLRTQRTVQRLSNTWGSLVRTIWALENFCVRRSMKQARASSQWKLPLWVPTRLFTVERAQESRRMEGLEGLNTRCLLKRRRLWVILWNADMVGDKKTELCLKARSCFSVSSFLLDIMVTLNVRP